MDKETKSERGNFIFFGGGCKWVPDPEGKLELFPSYCRNRYKSIVLLTGRQEMAAKNRRKELWG